MGLIRIPSKYRKVAKDNRFNDSFFDDSKSLDAALAHVMDELDFYGYKIVLADLDGFNARTLHKRIQVQLDYPHWNTLKKVAILAHELVHVRQRHHYGRHTFNVRYLHPGWRWAWECQAYRETCKVYRSVGVSKSIVDRYAKGRPAKIYKFYVLQVYRFQDPNRPKGTILYETLNSILT